MKTNLLTRAQLITAMDDLMTEVALIDTATPGDSHKAIAIQTIREIKAELMTKRSRKNDENNEEAEEEEI